MGYPRAQRITRSSQFRLVSIKGKRIRAGQLDVRSLASPLGYVRLGLVVPRHGQSAVERNRLKRQLRELGRTLLVHLPVSYDVVIRCRSEVYDLSFDELRDGIHRIADHLGGELSVVKGR
ncbi:MAG: ribonuclease P protein component [Gemmatimonadaceae bacterium]